MIYSDEIRNYVKLNHKGKSTIELSNEINKTFKINTNPDGIQNLKARIKKNEGFIFEPARNDGCYRKNNIPINKGKKWDEFMSKEGQARSRTTTFKKGNTPANSDLVGTEKWKSNHKNRDDKGYIYVKIQDKRGRYNWKQKHRIIYEKKYGPIPRGHKVIFADGNRTNFEIDNLILVSNSQELIMNRNKLIFDEKEFTKTGSIIAKVIDKSNKVKNERL